MKEIAGYPNYMIDSVGRVWSKNRNRFLLASKDKDGYMQVVLCKDGLRKTHRVHRLVAEAFIPNRDNLPVVNHLDGVKDNNCVENLEWCDVSHNTKHAYKIGSLNQKGERNNSCKHSDEVVKKIISEYDGGNITAYARSLGLKYGTVYSYLKQLRRS